MNAQVGPAVERAEETEHSVQAARVLTQQRERMFKSLVTRGNTLAEKLGVDAPAVPVHGNADAAAYLAYLDQLFTTLERPVAEMGDVVDEECRKLLTVAIDRLFANLQCLHPGFDFESVTKPVEEDQALDLSNLVRDEVNDYVDRFKRVEAEQAAEEEEGAEAAAEEEAEEDHDGDAPA